MDAGPGHRPTAGRFSRIEEQTWASLQLMLDQRGLPAEAEPEGCLAPAPARAGMLSRHAVDARAGGRRSARGDQAGMPGGPPA
jgi:hypothetical protein